MNSDRQRINKDHRVALEKAGTSRVSQSIGFIWYQAPPDYNKPIDKAIDKAPEISWCVNIRSAVGFKLGPESRPWSVVICLVVTHTPIGTSYDDLQVFKF